jgi:hypothetical protein
VYGRQYDGKTLRFEPSGGLANGALILQDKETDTYWSIMEGRAVQGKLSGTKLVELPLGEKMQWRYWREKHPDTLVLSVGGREDAPNGYSGYYAGSRGTFADATDERLPSMAPVFAFQHEGVAYAVPLEDFEGGKIYALEDGAQAFLYRRRGASMFQSTDAYLSSSGLERRDGLFVELQSGAAFDPGRSSFGDAAVPPLLGFDTFWYTWSLANPETRLLH